MEIKLEQAKILNDPVHGFMEVPRGILLELIDSPVFQRLRRIKQLGMSSLVYPGATHTRFNHALGAMHLMRQALDTLKSKSVPISDEEYEAAMIAILLHDIGHGPFSHALETSIITDLHHEDMSLALMHYLNERYPGRLDLAIEIFMGTYHRNFFHQLVSSQLDMDRMDYLVRDSFFTGVVEGNVGVDRIIKILNVYQDQLVCESKGIYSVENFIISRRFMYWQVYLHKAAIAAEFIMVQILKRAKELYKMGTPLFLGPSLAFFFHHQIEANALTKEVITHYLGLDDVSVEYAIKQWQNHKDFILSSLCRRILSRGLLKVKLQNTPFSQAEIYRVQADVLSHSDFTDQSIPYFVSTGRVSNQAYLKSQKEPIMIWFKSGELVDLAEVTDQRNIAVMAEPVVKYYLVSPNFPKKEFQLSE
ncbi:MAG: HD domain-containing protein [Bacteroidota bacterium]